MKGERGIRERNPNFLLQEVRISERKRWDILKIKFGVEKMAQSFILYFFVKNLFKVKWVEFFD